LLERRRSQRELLGPPLSAEELGELLWAAQGVVDAEGHRTAPSAGGLYPLELYVITAQGFFHYDPQDHRVARHREGDLRRTLAHAALEQDAVREAPAVFVFAAVYARIAREYGHGRTARYVHLEVGHAAQNLLLQAVALGLGAVPIGAFDDKAVQQALSLPDDHAPVYLVAVGHIPPQSEPRRQS
jgi:SagB-type dehydrogenase family enzyme